MTLKLFNGSYGYDTSFRMLLLATYSPHSLHLYSLGLLSLYSCSHYYVEAWSRWCWYVDLAVVHFVTCRVYINLYLHPHFPRTAGSKFRITLGLSTGAVVNCADNTGAKNLYMIAVKGYGGRLNRLPGAAVGDMIIASVKKGKPELRKKGMLLLFLSNM